MRRFRRFAVVCLSLCLSSAAQNISHPGPERYDATAFVEGRALGSAMTTTRNTLALAFYVDSYTPDDEFQNLVNVSRTQGLHDVEKMFDKLKERGRISPGTCPGGVRVARLVTNGQEKVIRLIMKCNLPDVMPHATFSAGLHEYSSEDFKFSVIELKLNPHGESQGVLVNAAKISFDDRGQLQVQPFDQTTVIKLGAVREVK